MARTAAPPRISIPIDQAEFSSVERGAGQTKMRRMTKRPLPTQPSGRRPQTRADDPEPSLSDLLGDPVLHAVMARDGVGCADLVGAIDAARARLGLGPWQEAPCGPAAFAATLFAECRA